MTTKIITNIILIISLGVAQISFINGLPGIAGNFNFVLVILIFILGFANFNFAIWWTIGIGAILEFFSFLPYGSYLISLSITLIIVNFLLNYFFTNRSLYSFLSLTGLAVIIYELIINFIILIFIKFGQYAAFANSNFLKSILEQIGLNLLLAFFIFYIIHFLIRKFTQINTNLHKY